MVQLRDATVCAARSFSSRISNRPEYSLDLVPASHWEKVHLGHTTSQFDAGVLLPGRDPGVIAAHFVIVLVSTVLQVFCANET